MRRDLPSEAFEHSLPLVGKLIDPYARILLDECIVMAALGARRWYEAVAYMDLRLRDAQEEDLGGAREQMRRALDAVPHEALELMLQTMQRTPSATGYGPEIRKLVIARLAAVAIEQQDTELARRLVESTSSSSSLGDATEGLEELASSGGAPVVDGRMIGLLVSTGSSHLGGRAAEVLTGVVDACDSPATRTPDHVRLTTRDEREAKRTELALQSSREPRRGGAHCGARPWASRNRRELCRAQAHPRDPAFADDDRGPLAKSAFVLGDRPRTARSRCSSKRSSAHGGRDGRSGGRLRAGRGSQGFNSIDAASCNAPALPGRGSRFPVADWRAAKVDSLLLLGDGSCAAEATGDAVSHGLSGSARRRGSKAADVAIEPPRSSVVGGDRRRFVPAEAGRLLRRMASRSVMARLPTWFAAFGHDAAVLARRQFVVPLDARQRFHEVKNDTRSARACLAAPKDDLWTTGARGFSRRKHHRCARSASSRSMIEPLDSGAPDPSCHHSAGADLARAPRPSDTSF